jgi:uncharacterized damage-inducible protein DinB
MYSCLDRLFRHLAWADQEILTAMDAQGSPIEPAQKLFSHIVVAEHIWLSRIHSRDIGNLTPWSSLSLSESRELSGRTVAGYLDLVTSIPEQRLNEIVAYLTTKGDELKSPLGDILLHVSLHGSYHRGQIATILRNNDLSVPMTDFIIFSRQLPSGSGPA